MGRVYTVNHLTHTPSCHSDVDCTQRGLWRIRYFMIGEAVATELKIWYSFWTSISDFGGVEAHNNMAL
jgi:hypothetical protein